MYLTKTTTILKLSHPETAGQEKKLPVFSKILETKGKKVT